MGSTNYPVNVHVSASNGCLGAQAFSVPSIGVGDCDVLPVLSPRKWNEVKSLFSSLSREQLVDLLGRACAIHMDVLLTVKRIIEESPSSRRLMIRNISFSTRNQELLDLLTNHFGPVEDFTIVREKETKRSKGFGFVTFKGLDSVKKALSMQLVVDNRNLIIKLANDQSDVSYTTMLMKSLDSQAPGEVSRRKVFVGGLMPETTISKLRASMSTFGTVEECVVINRPKAQITTTTPLTKIFGYVTYLRHCDALKAVQCKDRVIDGSNVFISFAVPYSNKASNGTSNGWNHNIKTQRLRALPNSYCINSPEDKELETYLKKRMSHEEGSFPHSPRFSPTSISTTATTPQGNLGYLFNEGPLNIEENVDQFENDLLSRKPQDSWIAHFQFEEFPATLTAEKQAFENYLPTFNFPQQEHFQRTDFFNEPQEVLTTSVPAGTESSANRVSHYLDNLPDAGKLCKSQVSEFRQSFESYCSFN